MNGIARNQTNGSQLRLVYIIGTYPLLTTTFIDREIRSLRREGVDVHVLAVRRPPTGSPLSADQRELQKGVQYMLPLSPAAVLAAQVYYALRRPVLFFGTLTYLLTRPHPGLAARWKTLLHFGQGVYGAFLLRRRKITELHAHFLDRAATIALVAGRLLGVPYSLSIHAGADIYVHPVLIREKLTHARQAVTCTVYNKRHLETLLQQDLNGKITCIPHGLDRSGYTPPDQPPEGRILILTVGQLAERKGFRYLIEACALLRERGLDFECQIVGGGLQRSQLEELIKKIGLAGQVNLTGALPHEQVMQKYRQATLFVMPCIQTAEGDVDGIPNVLLEAMAMELPVISTEVSAVPELIKPEWNGLLVPPNDASALAEAILRLLGDRELREAIARRGRETVLAEYDIEANIRRFYNTLWANGKLMEEGLV
jgi:glycosyltransferase involved in cell wall biosynthesis